MADEKLRMRLRVVGGLIGAPLLGLALLQLLAPEYLSMRGFPLDDAWIHAVYGRELARSFTLAFNPGEPATGATSPLWALVLAGPHLCFDDLGLRVLAIKLIGFGFHVVTVGLVYLALASAPRAVRWLSAALVALHPDLVAVSVSGMEVSLATAVALAMVVAVQWDRPGLHAGLTGIAFLARPELVVFAFLLPLLLAHPERRSATLRLWLGAGAGLIAAAAPLAVRHQIVSGMPLPATFYAKVGGLDMPLWVAERLGFSHLLGTFALTDSPLLMGGGVVLALIRLHGRVSGTSGPDAGDARDVAAAMFLSGAVFCAVSFALIPPHDWAAFYHQRYVLPAVPLLVAALPVLVAPFLARLPDAHRPWLATGAVAVLCAAIGVGSWQRYPRLENDAHNVDDMNVQIGMQLAEASPERVVWVTDAGAIRYFGGASVVDLKGLNTAEMLTAERERFLDARRPDYIQVMPIWLRLEPELQRQLPALRVEPSTPYTVTGFAAMQQMFLARCPAPVEGRFLLDAKELGFRCAG